MNKIMIIGSGGAGKSTLARQISEKLNIPVHHLDVYLWKPNWVMTTREEQIKIQNELVQNEAWIIDGNYDGTMEIRLQEADTIIFLDVPRQICLYRAFKRMIKYRDGSRPDMQEGNKEKFDFAFYKWIWNFPKKKRPTLLQRLNQLAVEKQVLVLHTSKEVDQFLTEL